MFTRIQTRSFRCLKAVDQSLGRFRALVGPNASGKTTFLDVIGFLGDLMRSRGDVLGTTRSRSTNFENLLWKNEGESFQLALEANIPESIRARMGENKQHFTYVRYEIDIGFDKADNEIGINHETLWLLKPGEGESIQYRFSFPEIRSTVTTILLKSGKNRNAAITKKPGGNDNYYAHGKKDTYTPSFKLGRGKSALANLPADEENFPVSAWFRNLLDQGVQPFILNSQAIHLPSPPGKGRRFQTDGSNLAWVIADLRKNAKQFNLWLSHVRTALGDINDIDTIERPEDKHRYIVLRYFNGAEVPSWLVSDGTLRLLALTIPAYLTDLEGTFLIEEPENGIHPRAIEAILQSLSSVYSGQVLIATHSVIALNMLDPHQILCFGKDETGATDIVAGDLHPVLKDWKKGEPDLGVLFASGILS
ncbi:AAA family ATPase [candidate division KSB1 bacterium]|nr:AAA family ATPase [candidate division KSB1 bacterium]